MLGQGEASFFGHSLLSLLDLGVVELFHPTAIQADQMVVVLALVEFEHCLAALEIAATQNPGLFKLGENPIDRGQANIGALIQQHPKYVLRAHMPLGAFLKNLQNLQSWQSRFEAGALEFFDVGHAWVLFRRRWRQPLQWSDHIASFRFMSVTVCASLGRRLLLLPLVLISACGSINHASNRLVQAVSPYRIEVVQGNVVSREQASALKPGMSRLQVRDILGTPLLSSVFHADRWDYVFTLNRQGVAPQSRRVTVFFKGDMLDRVEADELPTEAEFAATLERSTIDPAKLPKLEASPEQLQQFPTPTARAAQEQTLPPLPSSYPPLEAPAR